MVSYGFIMKKSPMKSPIFITKDETMVPWVPKKNDRLLFQEALVWVANDLAIGTGEPGWAWASQDRCLPSGKHTKSY